MPYCRDFTTSFEPFNIPTQMRVFMSLFGVMVAAVLGISFAQPIASLVHDARAYNVTNEAHGCTTALAATSCTVTLDHTTVEQNTYNMTVDETSPGTVNRTSTTAVAEDYETLTISGLTASTTYAFSIDYQRDNPANTSATTGVLKVTPLLFVLGIVILGAVAAFLAIRTWARGRE